MAGPLFDLNAYDAAFAHKFLTESLMKKDSLFLQAFPSDGFNAMSGKVPFVPQIGQLDDADETRVAIDGKASTVNSDIDSVDVTYKYKYAKRAELAKGVAESMSRIRNADDLVSHLVDRASASVFTAIDKDGATLLKDTNVNNTVAATAVWSDSTNARPDLDLEAACDKIGNPDVLFLDRADARAASKLPAFKPSLHHFDGVGASIGHRALAEVLMDRFGYREIFIDGTWYRTSNPAQALAKAGLFDGVNFSGYKEHVLVLENESYRDVITGYDRSRGVYYAEVIAMYVMVRADKDAGCILTGTKS